MEGSKEGRKERLDERKKGRGGKRSQVKEGRKERREERLRGEREG